MALSVSRWLVPSSLFAAALLVVSPIGLPCPVRALLGLPCPTCGITRATRLALHGDVAGATHMHPLVWLAVPVALGMVAVETAGFVRRGVWGSSRRIKGANTLLALTASLLFALWVARLVGACGLERAP